MEDEDDLPNTHQPDLHRPKIALGNVIYCPAFLSFIQSDRIQLYSLVP